LPLAVPLPGLIKGTPYTYRWTLILVLPYVAEGCVRAYSEPVPAAALALVEVALAATFFVSAIIYVRSTSRAI
jgi:uncharacterized membrane protein